MAHHRIASVGDICAVRIGFTARGRLKRAKGHGIPAIQMRDVPPGGTTVRTAGLERHQAGRIPDRYLVRSGDVLFRSRSDLNTASAFGDRLEEPAVVMSPLFILRPNPRAILPEFLAWSINQPRAQRHFDRLARGTNMRMIPRAVLTDLEIALPRLEVQRGIVALDALARREHALSIRAAEQRQRLCTRILDDLARPPTSDGWSTSLSDNLRLIFGVSDLTPTPPTRRTPHGPADID